MQRKGRNGPVHPPEKTVKSERAMGEAATGGWTPRALWAMLHAEWSRSAAALTE